MCAGSVDVCLEGVGDGAATILAVGQVCDSKRRFEDVDERAVKRCVPQSQWRDVVDTFDYLMQEHGVPSGLTFHE